MRERAVPQAYSILWGLGVFVVLWGLTLIARGIPGGAAARACRRVLRLEESRTGRVRRSPGDWRLVIGGVLVVAAGCVAIVGGFTVYRMLHGADMHASQAVWGSVTIGAMAFWLIAVLWAIRGQRTRTPRCPRCLYDMAGGGARCPECGFEARAGGDFLRPRRRMRLAIVALVMLAISPGLLRVPAYRQHGLVGVVPSTVLIAGLAWLPEHMIDRPTPAENGSLTDRYWNERLWRWQDAWLERRIVRLATAPQGRAATAARALRMNPVAPMEADPERAIANLVGVLEDESPNVRTQLNFWLYVPWVVEAASKHPAEIAKYEQRLAALLADADVHVSLAAAGLLLAGSLRVDEALETVIAWLAPGSGRRHLAAIAMRSAVLRSAARERLVELLRDPRPTAHGAAMAALQRQDLPEDTNAALMALLHDADVQVAVRAAEVLVVQGQLDWMGEILSAAAPRPEHEAKLLMVAVRSDPGGLYQQVPALASALRSENAQVRRGALTLLEELATSRSDIGDAHRALEAMAEGEVDAELRARAAALLRE
jgi:hypothetical protein